MTVNQIGSCFLKLDERAEGGGDNEDCNMETKEAFEAQAHACSPHDKTRLSDLDDVHTLVSSNTRSKKEAQIRKLLEFRMSLSLKGNREENLELVGE